MINGQQDLDQLLWDKFHQQILIDPADTTSFLPVFFGVAEEEVVDLPQIPGIRFAYQFDTSLENQGRVRHQPRIYRVVDDTGEHPTIRRVQPPTYRRLVYEVDLYTHKYLDMIELSQRVFGVLRREYGSFLDDDGNEIIYRLDGVTDMARRIDEERLFRRLFVFSFDAWVLEGTVDIGPEVRPIEHIRTDIKKTDGTVMESFWVDEDPPEQEDP